MPQVVAAVMTAPFRRVVDAIEAPVGAMLSVPQDIDNLIHLLLSLWLSSRARTTEKLLHSLAPAPFCQKQALVPLGAVARLPTGTT